MRLKHLLPAILIISAIIILQLSYLRSLYENFALKTKNNIEKVMYTSISGEYLYNLTNYDGVLRIIDEKEMNAEFRDSLLKIKPQPPTPPDFNIEELIDKGIIGSTSDIGRQYNADLNYDKGVYPDIERIDSIFCANIEVDYPHTFALINNVTGEIVFSNNADTASYEFQSKDFYIGTKARQTIVLYYDIVLDDFLHSALFGVFTSIILLLFAVVLLWIQARILLRNIAILKENRDNIGVVVHDLKSPLSTAIMTLKLLKDTADNNDIKTIVNHSSNSMSRLLIHIESLLWSTRNNAASKQVLTKDELIELSNYIATDLADTFNSKPHTFTIDTDSLPCNFAFSADKYLLVNTIRNLAENAIKYADDNVKVILTIAINNNGKLSFTLEDNGWGIAPKYQHKVFRYGFRVPQTKSNVRGHGIGLYGVKKMVKAQGGKISLKSELNKGTTINFTLPL